MTFIWNSENVVMDGDLYDSSKKTYRFCLIGNKNAKNPLIVLGLNPSTADNNKPDPTMRRVISFMERNGFDGFIMINLYPLRTPSPKILKLSGVEDEIHKINLSKIESYVQKIKNPNILLAFGSKIKNIPDLRKYLIDIINICKLYNPNWYSLKVTKEGHPGHPLYLQNDSKLSRFDVDNYIKLI